MQHPLFRYHRVERSHWGFTLISLGIFGLMVFGWVRITALVVRKLAE